jgi:hypothetical protein
LGRRPLEEVSLGNAITRTVGPWVTHLASRFGVALNENTQVRSPVLAPDRAGLRPELSLQFSTEHPFIVTLFEQALTSSRLFVVLTTTGVHVVARVRPVDIVVSILTNRAGDSTRLKYLESIFGAQVGSALQMMSSGFNTPHTATRLPHCGYQAMVPTSLVAGAVRPLVRGRSTSPP